MFWAGILRWTRGQDVSVGVAISSARTRAGTVEGRCTGNAGHDQEIQWLLHGHRRLLADEFDSDPDPHGYRSGNTAHRFVGDDHPVYAAPPASERLAAQLAPKA